MVGVVWRVVCNLVSRAYHDLSIYQTLPTYLPMLSPCPPHTTHHSLGTHLQLSSTSWDQTNLPSLKDAISPGRACRTSSTFWPPRRTDCPTLPPHEVVFSIYIYMYIEDTPALFSCPPPQKLDWTSSTSKPLHLHFSKLPLVLESQVADTNRPTCLAISPTPYVLYSLWRSTVVQKG
jgi:hypothetical protein